MQTVIIVLGSLVGYLAAYRLYGRFIARRLFELSASNRTAAWQLRDDVDYVPTRRAVLFGHHFTSIAGVGPIVGPAIGIMYGWLPALLWVLLGSVFMGAVHDLAALVVSTRGGGRSIGEIAADVIGPRVRTLFLVIIFLALTIVLAIFCLVIALLFRMYPSSVLPVWFQIPIALVAGHLMYRRGLSPFLVGFVSMVVMYLSVIAATLWFPVRLPSGWGFSGTVMAWTVLLMVYVYVASTLPVWRLLQPRDYINSFQLGFILLMLFSGALAAHPAVVAPVARWVPAGGEGMWMFPFMFIIIACGAISGFHSLVSSGTTSKQLYSEEDALPIAYGGMLTEGMLAVLVIVAVGAGIGMGVRVGGEVKTGTAAWLSLYADFGKANSLGVKVGAFVEGASNMLAVCGVPRHIAVGILGVIIASFAGTTLDSATRIQRYVVSELARSAGLGFLQKKHPATLFAVVTALALAAAPYGGKFGMGGLILWPLFGATNQLIGALALMVATMYLARRRKPLVFTVVPMCLMLAVTTTAMVLKVAEFWSSGISHLHLLILSVAVLLLEAWMVVEVTLCYLRMKEER